MPTLENIPAGVYSVTVCAVADANCCSEASITVSDNSDMFAEVISTSPADCAVANGEASVTPGFASYLWSNGNITANPTDLPAGENTVTIEDINGCQLILTVFIETNSSLEATANIISEPDCNAANGEVEINVTGGTGPYDYDWTPPYADDSGSTTLPEENYEVIVTDQATGCKDTVVFTLLENVPSATVTINAPTEVSCFGDADGTLDFTVTYDPGFVSGGDLIIKRIPSEGGFIVENGELSAGTISSVLKMETAALQVRSRSR